MMKQKLRYWLGFGILLMSMCFFFYRSIISEPPFRETLAAIENLQNLQIQLHRDVLRYRSSQIYQYDSLNKIIEQVRLSSLILEIPNTDNSYPAIKQLVTQLKSTISHQEDLVENFKTHHSILQNSLTNYSRISGDLYSNSAAKNDPVIFRKILGQLSTLILEYARSPKHETALKLYPIIDALNHEPSTEVNTLINHTIMIIERLPEIDAIIQSFNTLNTEQQIINIKEQLQTIFSQHEDQARIFNTLLFICTLYLAIYVALLFFSLQRNKNTLAEANQKLYEEVDERAKTEKSLYSFVEGTSERCADSIYTLLNSLCKSLHVRYAYLTFCTDNNNQANLAGLIDNGLYKSGIKYNPENSPCEEVLKQGRLVYNRDLNKYFPDWNNVAITHAESYIGVTIHDNENKVIGLLAVADDKPVENTNFYESILTLAASRAGTELLRQLAAGESKRYQNGLELIDRWIARLIASSIDTRLFFENACYAAQEISDATLSALPVLDRDNGLYSFITATGNNSEILKETTMSIHDGGICGWVMLNKSSLRIDDVTKDIRTQKQITSKLNIRSALATPILLNNDVYGAICVFRNDTTFDEIDELLLTQFSQSVQMAIINLQLLKDVESERERAEVTLHSIADAVITTNAAGMIEYMNHVAESLTGWLLAEARNKPVQTVFRILDHDTNEPMHDLVEACLEDGTSINKSMTTLLSKDGIEKEIESSMSTITNSSGKPDGAVIVFHDETERRHMEHVIMHQATHDSLTGLNNRNEFDRQLTEHIYDSRNYGRQHALCYLDLDRFKLVNDTSGHAAGDELLRQITALLHSCIRSGDILGRLGGDEFGLILGNCSHNSAERISEKIINEISNHQFNWGDKTFNIGASIGLVPITSETENTTEVMKQADLACFTAKDMGRNRIYVYENEDSELRRREDEMHWVGRIKHALDNNRLRLHAQTIYPISRSGPCKMHIEILVRLLDDNDNLILPSSFIPAAERFNLMGIIDRHIIRSTFEFIASRDDHIQDNVCYSINLSGNSLNDEYLSNYIRLQLDEYTINPSHICFEITETAAITNLHMARKLMTELKECGCWFALDDFGSGLSSFEYLRNLPVDYLKIDGSFVRDMVNNKIDHAMVAAINQIGHVMEIQTIAEFVETDQIMDTLIGLNVDYAQGYAISRPIPLEEIDFDFLTMTNRELLSSGRA